MAFLDPDAFRRHEYRPDDSVQVMYHVYDNLSQTPYIPGNGINAGDPNTYYMHPQHIITYSKISQHLDWSNREPTYFISCFGNLEAAREEANRRKVQSFVPDRQRRWPQTVQIAAISIAELHRLNVFYFSRSELIYMLRVPVSHPIFSLSSSEEWFVMGFIPDSAVI